MGIKKIKWYLEFLKVLNSPFKPLRLSFYFGDIQRGVPYFLPKGMWNVHFVPLGYKTKWSNTDYRFEWSPALSIVLFGKQLHIKIEPKIKKDNNFSFYEDSYWSCWLVYEYHTDTTLSKEERLKHTMEIYPCIWSHSNGEKTTVENHYYYILKNNYKKYTYE